VRSVLSHKFAHYMLSLDSAADVEPDSKSNSVEMGAVSSGEYPSVDQQRELRGASNKNGKWSHCVLLNGG
jgi:hypothetical protein